MTGLPSEATAMAQRLNDLANRTYRSGKDLAMLEAAALLDRLAAGMQEATDEEIYAVSGFKNTNLLRAKLRLSGLRLVRTAPTEQKDNADV